jgi:hypothetical protein
MNQISVSTQARSDGQFDVAYRIHEAHPLANGIVQVFVAPHYTADRAIIAELAALRYLLCEAQVCGQQRTGQGLQVEVSFGAIRRAVLQGALKATDAGKTDKAHIVPHAHFLATRFFEASKAVVNAPVWAKGCMLKYRQHAIAVTSPQESILPTRIGEAVISRHALNRFVERFIARDVFNSGGGRFENLPDVEQIASKYWTRAWRSLEKLLNSPDTVIRAIASSKFGERMKRKYGKQARFLHHPDSMAIFILIPEGRRLVLATVVRDFEENRCFEKAPGMSAAGWCRLERSRQWRERHEH